MPYEKPDAIRDLIAIIHACSSDANADNPWCEVRMGKNGLYYRFPPKLQAMARLMKLMGWDEPEKVEVELKDNFVALLEKARRPGWVVPPPPASLSDGADSPEASADVAHDSWDTPCIPEATPSDPATPAVAAVPATLEASAAGDYTRAAAVADLVTIIHARPNDASPNHPLCEMRMTSWGPYHRFPMKLAALTLLARMLGWNQPTQVQVAHDPDAKFKALQEFVMKRK